jgi:hypothetical protein
MEFFIRKLNNREFDCFEGKQYHPDFWTRLRSNKHGVFIRNGRSLPHAVVRQLAEAINPHEEAQLVQIAG